MLSIYNFLSDVFVTIWGYELSYLEFIAVVASFIGVALGITGKRITWPWWAMSSALYGVLFIQWELYASAALQIVFIIAAVIGWFGWEPSGAKPGALNNRQRAIAILAIILATLALAPLLKSWGAASTYADAISFGSDVIDKKLVTEFSSVKGKKVVPFNGWDSDLTEYLDLYNELAGK